MEVMSGVVGRVETAAAQALFRRGYLGRFDQQVQVAAPPGLETAVELLGQRDAFEPERRNAAAIELLGQTALPLQKDPGTNSPGPGVHTKLIDDRFREEGGRSACLGLALTKTLQVPVHE